MRELGRLIQTNSRGARRSNAERLGSFDLGTAIYAHQPKADKLARRFFGGQRDLQAAPKSRGYPVV